MYRKTDAPRNSHTTWILRAGWRTLDVLSWPLFLQFVPDAYAEKAELSGFRTALRDAIAGNADIRRESI